MACDEATGRTALSRAELQEVAGKGHGPALKTLADKGLVAVVDGAVHFTLEPAAVVQARLALRGSGRWLPPLQALSGMGGGAWKSDLPGEFREPGNLAAPAGAWPGVPGPPAPPAGSVGRCRLSADAGRSADRRTGSRVAGGTGW